MPTAATPDIRRTRGQITEAADRLFYEQGFGHTSFADVAGAVGISRGNFYHHFKSKDDILAAVIEGRLERTRALLQAWEAQACTPIERLHCFVQMLLDNQPHILAHGCPVGTLCGELAKLDHPALEQANGLLVLFRDWLRQQFEAMGRTAEADALALHLLARAQGVAAVAHALRSEAFVRAEVYELQAWLTAQQASGSSLAGARAST
ncbi:MAG: TetR/AcrR family transcriptional regulator [Burkholderiales bacterium]|jgi:AcrR family transcriptional regulator|nr:TetR/AcrR family transcriptional regulator [Burkholderiales bacterium]